MLNATYRGRLDLAGVPAQVADAARDSVFAGVAVAHRLGSAPLLDSVQAAFVHGTATLTAIGASFWRPQAASRVDCGHCDRDGGL